MSIVILDSTLNYLRFNCIWPNKNQELKPSKSYHIKFIIMMLSSLVVLVGSTLHLTVSQIHHSNVNISEDLVMIIAETGVYYFLSSFVLNQKEIAKIYVSLSDFQKFAKPINFETRNNELIRLSKAYKMFINIALVGYFGFSILSKRACEKANEERDFKEICGLVAATWMPFDIDRFPLKQFFFLWQSYTFLMTLKGAAVISFAIMETMEHLVVRIQHLKILLREAINCRDNQLSSELFPKCIDYHIEIFRLSETGPEDIVYPVVLCLRIGQEIDKYYTNCLFLHVILSGALFGCIGYRFMESTSLNTLCLFAGWFLSLHIVCVSGQHVINEALSVADAVYNTKWYEKDAPFQKSVNFIIMRSRKPIVIHAGPVSFVSHVIILTILKTAYSYMTLLNATASK